jgi:hypothetical protein
MALTSDSTTRQWSSNATYGPANVNDMENLVPQPRKGRQSYRLTLILTATAWTNKRPVVA